MGGEEACGERGFIILIAVTVFTAYTCVKAQQTVYFEYVEFTVCQSYSISLLKVSTLRKCNPIIIATFQLL